MKILKHQLWHFLSLIVLLTGIYFYLENDTTLLQGALWEIPTSTWFLIAILSPILHQVYVVVGWRLELFYQSFSKAFGVNAFLIFKIGFAILIFSRILTITLLAISSANTLSIDPTFAYLIAGLLFIPAVYLFYSVKKYFGIDRAYGLSLIHI